MEINGNRLKEVKLRETVIFVNGNRLKKHRPLLNLNLKRNVLKVKSEVLKVDVLKKRNQLLKNPHPLHQGKNHLVI